MMGISGFGWFFGAKKSLKLSCDDFIPENLYFGVKFDFSKMSKIQAIFSLLRVSTTIEMDFS